MKSLRLLSFAALALMPLITLAHGPTPKKVLETVTIDAPADQVWAKIKEFGAIADWHPLIIESKGSNSNEMGAERILVLGEEFGAGGEITESLDEYDAERRYYGYRLAQEDTAVFPVSFHSASLEVKAGEDGVTTVEWIARFYRGDTGNSPPEQLNDEAAVAAITRLFQTGLEGLKKACEWGQ